MIERLDGKFSVQKDTLTSAYSSESFQFYIQELCESKLVATPMQGTIMLKMRKLKDPK